MISKDLVVTADDLAKALKENRAAVDAWVLEGLPIGPEGISLLFAVYWVGGHRMSKLKLLDYMEISSAQKVALGWLGAPCTPGASRMKEIKDLFEIMAAGGHDEDEALLALSSVMVTDKVLRRAFQSDESNNEDNAILDFRGSS